jgi:DNA-binding transcriptional LysR family regulator
MEPLSDRFTIELRRLRVLRELHQRGTVSAAAAALNLTPSAVSQQIAALGREVGVPLLAPQGRGVRLTPQALLLLEHAAAIEAQMERARADLAGCGAGTHGRVGIGAFATAIVALVRPALERLRRERPHLRLQVQETDAPDCFAHLDNGSLDLVLTVDHGHGPSLADPRYARLELLDDPLLAVLPADHPLAVLAAVDLADLAGAPWIVGAVRGPCQEAALAACAAAGFAPEVRHRVNDWQAVLGLVAAGCGVALVPRLALAGPVPPGLALRPLGGDQRPSRHIFAACRAGAQGHPCLAPVLEALRSIAQDSATVR